MHKQPRQLVRRTRHQRVHGIEIEERAWKLSLEGLKQVDIAVRLGISPTRVSRYLTRRMSRIEQNATQTPEELAVMRGSMKARLEANYAEAACLPDRHRGLQLQLKCLASMMKLFGLNMEGSNRSYVPQPVPSSTQAEIVEAVDACIVAMNQSAPNT
jgi:hypothetical protein